MGETDPSMPTPMVTDSRMVKKTPMTMAWSILVRPTQSADTDGDGYLDQDDDRPLVPYQPPVLTGGSGGCEMVQPLIKRLYGWSSS